MSGKDCTRGLAVSDERSRCIRGAITTRHRTGCAISRHRACGVIERRGGAAGVCGMGRRPRPADRDDVMDSYLPA
jgi:hypothetical protein